VQIVDIEYECLPVVRPCQWGLTTGWLRRGEIYGPVFVAGGHTLWVCEDTTERHPKDFKIKV